MSQVNLNVQEWRRCREFLFDLSRDGVDTVIHDGRRWSLVATALDRDGEPLYRLVWLRELDED